MGYLIRNDYKGLIQTDNLAQILGTDYTILTRAEAVAQSEIVSYLTQKYDTAKEFTSTLLYAYGVTRNAKDRVYLDATAYSGSSTYALNSLMLLNSMVYRCTTAITSPEGFVSGHWTLIGNQYDIYYASNPYPDWNYYTEYVTGNQIFYKNKTYTALSDNTALAPDKNPTYWGSGTTYTVAGSIVPTDATKWTLGDNRNAEMVQYIVEVVLYHVHSRIAPRNIPNLRVKRYDEIISWLKNASKGDWLTASLPKIQPNSGMRTRWGSKLAKQNNTY